jgi:MFS transporter, DHA1 family, inner membrane transport protein
LSTSIPLPAVMPHSLTNLQLAIVTIARLVITVAFRIIYPLLPFLTQALAVDLTTVSVIVTVQLLAALISPVAGTMADSYGERSVMCVGLILFCLGAIVCASSTLFLAFLAGYALIGLGVASYQPAVGAYVSARTPYARRAWALGILETSWAGAALLGVAPLMLLVQATQSVAPVYWALFAIGLVSLVLIWQLLPPTPRHHTNQRQPIQWNALRSGSVVAAIAMLGMVLFAYDLFGVSQGAWLKAAFAADEAMLGQAVGVSGIGELIGVLAVIFIVDRIGKKKATIIGFALSAGCFALFPLTAGNWWLFLGVLLLFFIAIEFAIVSAIPLISGIAPAARATVMALSMAITSIIRAAGSAISAPVWQMGGIAFNTYAAALLTALAVVVCWQWVHEGEQ